jgi:hypothetical protein
MWHSKHREIQLSALDKLTELVKSGENEVAGALTAAHKMVTEALGSPAKPSDKPAAAHTDAAKPEAHKPEAIKVEAAKPADQKAAAPPAKNTMEKAAAVADGKPGSTLDSKAAIEAAKSCNMDNAAAFIAAAALPEFSIVGATAAAVGAAGSYIYDAVTGSGDNAAKPPSVPAATDKPAQGAHTPIAGGTDSTKAPDINKFFKSVKTEDANVSWANFLKQSGCDDGDSCKVDPTVKLSFGDLQISGATNVKTGQGADEEVSTQVSKEVMGAALQTVDAVTGSHLSENKLNGSVEQPSSQADKDLAAAIRQAKAADRSEPSGGRSVHTADGVTHYNDKGQVDWEKHGDTTIKTVDGIKTVVDSKAHTMVMTDAQGNKVLEEGANGHWQIHTQKLGKDVAVDIDPKSSEFSLYQDGKPVGGVAKLTKDGFTQQIDRVKVALVAQAFDITAPVIDQTFALGESGYASGPNGTQVTGKDGFMFVAPGENGIVGMHLNHGNMTFSYDPANKTLTLDQSGKKTHLNEAEVKLLVAEHPEQMQTIMGIITNLKNFNTTHVLKDREGNSITKEQNGDITARVGALVATTSAVDGTTAIKTAEGLTEKIDLKRGTNTISDTKSGTVFTTMKADAQGRLSADTDRVHYDGASNTAHINGTNIVAGAHSVNYGDGTNINYNGTVSDKYGTTFNNEGEIVEIGSSSYATKSAAGGSNSESAQENAAKSQVAAAESIASSVRGMIAGGHASAGAIAALQSSMASLSVLIGSLSQFSDSSALASAVMAQDDVAGSLELALSNVGSNNKFEGQRAA